MRRCYRCSAGMLRAAWALFLFCFVPQYAQSAAALPAFVCLLHKHRAQRPTSEAIPKSPMSREPTLSTPCFRHVCRVPPLLVRLHHSKPTQPHPSKRLDQTTTPPHPPPEARAASDDHGAPKLSGLDDPQGSRLSPQLQPLRQPPIAGLCR